MAYDLIERPSDAMATTEMDLVQGGAIMQQTRTQYTTAVSVQRPRVLEHARKRLLEEAALAGESFYYSWGAGKDRIEGKSEGLAYAAARCWGNCAVDSVDVKETPDSYVITSAFIDLETGCTITRPFRQSKNWTVYGKLDAERKSDIRFGIGATKSQRNVILKALPKWLTDQALEAAKAGVRAKLETFIKQKGIAAAIELVTAALAKEGVSEEQIAAKFDLASVRALTVDHLVILRGDLSAIQSGQEYADVLFPAKKSKADEMASDFDKRADQPQDAPPEQPEPETVETPTDAGDATQGDSRAIELDARVDEYAALIESMPDEISLGALSNEAREDKTLQSSPEHAQKVTGLISKKRAKFKEEGKKRR